MLEDDDLSDLPDLIEMDADSISFPPELLKKTEYVPQNAQYTKGELDLHIAAFAERREYIANLDIDLNLLGCDCKIWRTCRCYFDDDKFDELTYIKKQLLECMKFDCPGHVFNKELECVICMAIDDNQFDQQHITWLNSAKNINKKLKGMTGRL